MEKVENDKFQVVVDHLVRVSQEITEIKLNQQEFSERLDKNSQAITRIENDHGQKLNALFDAWQTQQEVNERLLSTLSRMEEKLDNLSLKVTQHDLILQKRL